MNKPKPARSLADLVGKCLDETFARQGFASREIVTHWPTIVGADVAAHCEPIKMQWARGPETEEPEPATLILRVEGPVAIEIQHESTLIIERINRFFGWRAVGRIALRQAPLAQTGDRRRPAPPDPRAAEQVAAGLTGIEDEGLRAALGRLGAAIKRT